MKKTLFLLGLLVSATCLHAQTVYNSTCFESDFTTNSLPEGVTLSTEGSNYEATDNGLVITLDNLGQWKNVLTINFATPLDLSNDAILSLKGSAETSASGNARVRIRLGDSAGQMAPSDQQIWRTNINFAGTTDFDKQYNFAGTDMRNNIDLTQVKTIQIQTQDANQLNGTVTISKIKLGSTPEAQKTYYIDDFDSDTFADSDVSFNVDGGLPYTISNGALNFTIKANPNWGQLFEFTFQNPIDISACPELELVYTTTATSGAFQARLVDNMGTTTGDANDCIFWSSGTINFTNATIDLTKIKQIKFYDKQITGGAEFSIDKIRIGKEEKQPTNIAVPIKSDIKLYPSVVQNILHIQDIENDEVVSIYNISGQQVCSLHHENGIINVAHLASGIYLIKLSNTSTTFKFIKN